MLNQYSSESYYEDYNSEHDHSLQLDEHKIQLGSIEDFAKEIRSLHNKNDMEINRLRDSLSLNKPVTKLFESSQNFLTNENIFSHKNFDNVQQDEAKYQKDYKNHQNSPEDVSKHSPCTELENKISEMIKNNEKYLQDLDHKKVDQPYQASEVKNEEYTSTNSNDFYNSYWTPCFNHNNNSQKIQQQACDGLDDEKLSMNFAKNQYLDIGKNKSKKVNEVLFENSGNKFEMNNMLIEDQTDTLQCCPKKRISDLLQANCRSKDQKQQDSIIVSPLTDLSDTENDHLKDTGCVLVEFEDSHQNYDSKNVLAKKLSTTATTTNASSYNIYNSQIKKHNNLNHIIQQNSRYEKYLDSNQDWGSNSTTGGIQNLVSNSIQESMRMLSSTNDFNEDLLDTFTTTDNMKVPCFGLDKKSSLNQNSYQRNQSHSQVSDHIKYRKNLIMNQNSYSIELYNKDKENQRQSDLNQLNPNKHQQNKNSLSKALTGRFANHKDDVFKSKTNKVLNLGDHYPKLFQPESAHCSKKNCEDEYESNLAEKKKTGSNFEITEELSCKMYDTKELIETKANIVKFDSSKENNNNKKKSYNPNLLKGQKLAMMLRKGKEERERKLLMMRLDQQESTAIEIQTDRGLNSNSQKNFYHLKNELGVASGKIGSYAERQNSTKNLNRRSRESRASSKDRKNGSYTNQSKVCGGGGSSPSKHNGLINCSIDATRKSNGDLKVIDFRRKQSLGRSSLANIKLGHISK